MILLSIQNYFLKVKVATLGHLCKEFNLSEDILQDMLAVWIKKGKLKKILPEKSLSQQSCATRCSNCQLKCLTLKNREISQPQHAQEIYEWI